jgi:hypothetical protein
MSGITSKPHVTFIVMDKVQRPPLSKNSECILFIYTGFESAFSLQVQHTSHCLIVVNPL